MHLKKKKKETHPSVTSQHTLEVQPLPQNESYVLEFGNVSVSVVRFPGSDLHNCTGRLSKTHQKGPIEKVKVFDLFMFWF